MAQEDRFQGRVTAIEGLDGTRSEIEFSLRLPEGHTQRVRAARALAAIKEDDLVIVRGQADAQGIVAADSVTHVTDTSESAGGGRSKLVAIAAGVVVVAIAVAVPLLKSSGNASDRVVPPAATPPTPTPTNPTPPTQSQPGVLPEAVAAGQRVAIVNVNSNLCATVAGGNTLNNTEAVQFPCDEDPSRYWTFAIVDGTDVVQIKNVNSGLCLTVAGGNTDRNTPSVQYPCDTHPSRRWRIMRVDDQTFRIVNVNSNLCLTVAGGGRDRNTTLVQYPCDGDPSRDWRFRVTGGGSRGGRANAAGAIPPDVLAARRVAIVNVNSNLCATVAGGNTLNNTEAVQFPCDEDPSRYWTFAIVDGTDVVQIKNVNSGLCLTVAGGNTDRNTPSVQYPCDTHPSRRWRIMRVDDQTFRIVNVNSNLCLTVAGGGRDRNTTLVQYPCDGDPSRDWRLRVSQ